MSLDSRDQFLIAMYNKMWENINRHILIVWHSVSVLAGAFAALALEQNKVLPLDLSTTLIIFLWTWQVANILDAAWWFNRNLVIITNIERQFLPQGDIADIHYYFSRHRQPEILDHYKIQLWFGAGVAGLVLLYHFSKRVLSSFTNPWPSEYFDLTTCLPYLALLICAIVLYRLYAHQKTQYETLKAKSPGKSVSFEDHMSTAQQ